VRGRQGPGEGRGMNRRNFIRGVPALTLLSGPAKEVAQSLVPEERVLELIEAAEAYPNYTKLMEASAAYRDVAQLLRELLEHRGAK